MASDGPLIVRREDGGSPGDECLLVVVAWAIGAKKRSGRSDGQRQAGSVFSVRAMPYDCVRVESGSVSRRGKVLPWWWDA
jgi:hypothetical protein